MTSTFKDYEISNYKELFLNLFECSQNSILLLTEEGLILNCNKATEKFFDIDKHQLIGKNFKDFTNIPSRLYIFSENGIKSIIGNNLTAPTEFSHKKDC